MTKFFLTVLTFSGAFSVMAGEAAAVSRYYGTVYALLPPLVAIILALLTKEVYSSLFAGVLLGGLLAADFQVLWAMDHIVVDGLTGAVQGTAGVFIFLVILGSIVALINRTGAAAAFGRWAKNHVKTRQGAMLATFAMGILIFIDDYFNCLTVGNVMMPVTDAKKISRAKLAYLVDATAAPICMIAPISSWAAAVSEYADGSEISGLELFILAIPYNFYSLLTLVFVFALIMLKVDYGPMAREEKNAEMNEVIASVESSNTGKGGSIDMIIPTVLLIIISILALVYAGGILDGKSFIDAFGATDASVALPLGGLLALIFTIFYLQIRKVVSFKEAMTCIPQGFIAMVPAIIILTLATALKNMTGLLNAAGFIGGIVGSNAEGLAQLLPAVIFLVACFLSFSTGTAWGTFGILIPIVAGIFPPGNELLYISISACLAGSVCGDHCSPISDTTIMSSAGSNCDHLLHVSTQMPYALTVAVISLAGFLLAGFIPNWFVVFPILILLLVATLLGLRFVCRRH